MPMIKMPAFRGYILTCYMLVTVLCRASGGNNQEPIALQEAKQLLALTPEFMNMSSKGWSYFFDAQRFGVGFNDVDFYFFEVSSRKKGDQTSEIIGHFAVNKWTGGVLDISSDEQGVRISSPQLKKLQSHLQRKHHITQEKLSEERNVHPALVKK